MGHGGAKAERTMEQGKETTRNEPSMGWAVVGRTRKCEGVFLGDSLCFTSFSSVCV